MAGKRAKASSAYKLALTYLRTALKLLGEDSWDRHYELSLIIHEEAAEAANVDENHTNYLIPYLRPLLRNAKTTLDKVNVYITQVSALVKQGKPNQAVNDSLSILKELGCNLPRRPNRFHVIAALLRTSTLAKIKKFE